MFLNETLDTNPIELTSIMRGLFKMTPTLHAIYVTGTTWLSYRGTMPDACAIIKSSMKSVAFLIFHITGNMESFFTINLSSSLLYSRSFPYSRIFYTF